jgi:hypothetical protein
MPPRAAHSLNVTPAATTGRNCSQSRYGGSVLLDDSASPYQIGLMAFAADPEKRPAIRACTAPDTYNSAAGLPPRCL